MITWVTVWMLVVSDGWKSGYRYQIPYQNKQLCDSAARDVKNSDWGRAKAKCVKGQMPIYSGVKK